MKNTAKLALFLSCVPLVGLLGSWNSPTNIKSSNEEVQKETDNNTLKILNAEDYIYLQEKDTDLPDLTDQFVAYIKEKTGRDINIVYDTYDTNESMLSELKTGKTTYDLICASDYTLQRMAVDDLIIPFEDDKTPNYKNYVSRYLTGKLKDIEVKGKTDVLTKYARGYMRGTVGLMYNPDYYKFSTDAKENIEEDMKSWSSLWNSRYRNTISIKDSLRDTYAVGIIEAYKSELTELQAQFETDGDAAKYNAELTEIFNRSDSETLSKVLDSLLKLKENIYGFEVDSGKDDIVKGLIGINIAWSGDAVYALEVGEENGLNLEYNIPEVGSNIWFDGWAMPKNANKDLAQEFIDFISNPTNAIQNMDYTGYTSFIAGDEVLDYVKESYDISNTTTDGYKRDLSYFFKESLEEHSIDDAKLIIEEENRQFDAAYPSEDELPHLAVMDDFGDRLSLVLTMWENLKATIIPVYVYIIVLLLVVLGGGAFTYSYVHNYTIIKKRREKRKNSK